MLNAFSSPMILQARCMNTHHLSSIQENSRIEGGTTFADDGGVPLLFNRNGVALDIRCIFGPLKQFFLDLVNIFGFLDRRW
jgi:hypothetical protein